MSESEDIMQLRQQVADLRAERDEARLAYRGACYDRDQIKVERDEARREVCAWQGATSGKSFKDTAAVRGWDCFKEPA
jgi:hypothetical protein